MKAKGYLIALMTAMAIISYSSSQTVQAGLSLSIDVPPSYNVNGMWYVSPDTIFTLTADVPGTVNELVVSVWGSTQNFDPNDVYNNMAAQLHFYGTSTAIFNLGSYGLNTGYYWIRPTCYWDSYNQQEWTSPDFFKVKIYEGYIITIDVGAPTGASIQLHNIANWDASFQDLSSGGERVLDLVPGDYMIHYWRIDWNGWEVTRFTVALDGTVILGTSDSPANWSVVDNKLVRNRVPVANAGSDQIVGTGVGAVTCSAGVILDGSGSSDPDGDALTYAWTWNGGSASGVNPVVELTVGSTTVTLTVNDGNLTATDMVVITVIDTTPPVIGGLTASPDCLWSPNHKMVDVVLDIDVSDNCSATENIDVKISAAGVTSDETTASIRGAGRKGGGVSLHVPDAEIISGDIVSLRAERSGTGDGRVYEIIADVKATDSDGNSTTTTGLKIQVVVPHDEADNCSAVDNGQKYNATEAN